MIWIKIAFVIASLIVLVGVFHYFMVVRPVDKKMKNYFKDFKNDYRV